MTDTTAQQDSPPGAAALLILSAAAAFLALMATALSPDPLFRLEGWIFTSAALASAAALTVGVANGRYQADPGRYEDGVIRAGAIATVFWAIVGMLVGVVIALQLAWPRIFYFPDHGWLNFGRLRPLHTSGVIFAFGGNALIATSFYVVQRTCRARLAGGMAGWFVFWGYQLFIVMAAVGYLAGITEGREYAEPEWFVDLWLTIVWVVYLLVFLGTLWKRKEPHIYVANWFYLAFIVTVALLHIVNNLSLPVSLLGAKSYSLFAGVQDALTQWWYGHNAVGFFLTAGFLAIMYYFVPKRAEKPVYSYRLSIVHFWSLIFIYIWAGPHHLHYTALPQWAQTLGMTFSIMLWMPSWGGMINGLMTLSGAWDKLRTDPVLRMMAVAVGFYGMSTFEGPMMSIKTVNSLSHYTDWTIGHVHSGALGWVAMISIGSLYYLIPRLFGRTEMHSVRAITVHFWVATIGVVLYIAAMWIAGVMQGLMWRAVNADGTLTYTFVESVKASYPFYAIRLLGGAMYLAGMLIMAWNVWKTVAGSRAVDAPVMAPAAAH
ncbi:cytochrome-c oxidase, cbb3-type subunit I [Phenylobacterium sp.]|uniref:cytochrome-c oxidase, cbb3-type subunit I n=1 Tax=Phenylobacterium sp. TaxID=1871053 RepID=UPI0025CD9737|nr:cytochrome-c oxidase, cbb3-type subunit I [Phenylobacterium sp.]MCA6261354.1 cytochrome-c oxidase, cbb3-type subunit I [Phenylobacterium sp.]